MAGDKDTFFEADLGGPGSLVPRGGTVNTFEAGGGILPLPPVLSPRLVGVLFDATLLV